MTRAAAPAGAGAGQVPGFAMRRQNHSNWCWAAVAQAVGRHRGSNLSQQQIATLHRRKHQGLTCDIVQPGNTGGTQCRPKPVGCDMACNGQHAIANVLLDLGLWANSQTNFLENFTASPTVFGRIRAEIRAGRPVPARIGRRPNSKQGHFICIAGFADDGGGDRLVTVLDPLPVGTGPASPRTFRFEDLWSYRGGLGSITHLYFVG